MGGTWKESDTYKWYGRWVNDYHQKDAAYQQGVNTKDYGKCNYAVSFPKCKYEVGVIKEGEEYRLIWDFYDHELKKVMGEAESSPIKQLYAVEATWESLEAQGFTWNGEESVTDKGVIEREYKQW